MASTNSLLSPSSSVSTFFLVEDWVFGDYYPDRETFKKIILDPSLQDQYRPEAMATPLKPVIKEDGLSSAASEDDLEEAISKYHRKIKTTDSFKFLEQYFVPLEMIENPELRKDPIRANFDLDGDWENYKYLMINDNKSEIENNKQVQYGDVIELIHKEKQLILLGSPGSGKTTCLQMCCFKSIKKYQSGDKVYIYRIVTTIK